MERKQTIDWVKLARLQVKLMTMGIAVIILVALGFGIYRRLYPRPGIPWISPIKFVYSQKFINGKGVIETYPSFDLKGWDTIHVTVTSGADSLSDLELWVAEKPCVGDKDCSTGRVPLRNTNKSCRGYVLMNKCETNEIDLADSFVSAGWRYLTIRVNTSELTTGEFVVELKKGKTK